jgi:ADP-ribose pyrophosphatase YjhB (NUDIX family)
MVRERSDADRWTLPGGWADVTMTLGECVVKEVREETGYHVRVRKLAAVWDRTRQGHGSGVFSCVKVFFLCDLVGGTATPSLETTEVQWFAEPDIPADLSRGRTLPHQVRRMFEHARNERLGTDFE